MRRLAPRVNVIPVIGKSDTLTPSELRDFKKRIMEDIEYYSIPVYNFPFDLEEDDEETIEDNSELRVSLSERLGRPLKAEAFAVDRRSSTSRSQNLLPFAIVGSEENFMLNGESVRGRRYPWGIVEVDNPDHSDFSRLRHALLISHLTDLKEITHDFL